MAMKRRIAALALTLAIGTAASVPSAATAQTVGTTPQLQRSADGSLTIPIAQLGGTLKGRISEMPAPTAVPRTIYNSYVFPGGDNSRALYAPHSGLECTSMRAASATEASAAIPQLGIAQPSQTLAAVSVDDLGNGQTFATNLRDAGTYQRFAQSCARASSS